MGHSKVNTIYCTSSTLGQPRTPKLSLFYCVCSRAPSKVDGIYCTSSTWERQFSQLGRHGRPEGAQGGARGAQGEPESAQREPRGGPEGAKGAQEHTNRDPKGWPRGPRGGPGCPKTPPQDHLGLIPSTLARWRGWPAGHLDITKQVALPPFEPWIGHFDSYGLN